VPATRAWPAVASAASPISMDISPVEMNSWVGAELT
jgi:hypothetical protein